MNDINGNRSWFTLKKRQKEKTLPIYVSTFESELDFNINSKAKGHELFESVCKILGIRETWYFGLQYTDKNGDISWLKMNKKIIEQCSRLKHSTLNVHETATLNRKKSSSFSNIQTHEKYDDYNVQFYSFEFLVKFYPEDIEEIFQPITLHFLFLQVCHSILNMDIYCPPEASVLLASYSLQSKYGDIDPSRFSSFDTNNNNNSVKENSQDSKDTSDNAKKQLLYHQRIKAANMMYKGGEANQSNVSQAIVELPTRVLNQFQMSTEMWEDRIKLWYEHHKGMPREDAELEYLKIAQDLDMYGIVFFNIFNKKKTELWLGVSALGLSIYEKENKLTPKIFFPWNEIRIVSMDGKRFTIKLLDKQSPPFVFYASKTHTIKIILELCIGNHDLFLRRRKPDTLEVQQMKIQAKEEKTRREMLKQMAQRERERLEEIEKKRKDLEEQLEQLKKDNDQITKALKKSEETTEILAEKSKMAQEESYLLAFRAKQSQLEIDSLKNSLVLMQHTNNGHIHNHNPTNKINLNLPSYMNGIPANLLNDNMNCFLSATPTLQTSSTITNNGFLNETNPYLVPSSLNYFNINQTQNSYSSFTSLSSGVMLPAGQLTSTPFDCTMNSGGLIHYNPSVIVPNTVPTFNDVLKNNFFTNNNNHSNNNYYTQYNYGGNGNNETLYSTMAATSRTSTNCSSYNMLNQQPNLYSDYIIINGGNKTNKTLYGTDNNGVKNKSINGSLTHLSGHSDNNRSNNSLKEMLHFNNTNIDDYNTQQHLLFSRMEQLGKSCITSTTVQNGNIINGRNSVYFNYPDVTPNLNGLQLNGYHSDTKNHINYDNTALKNLVDVNGSFRPFNMDPQIQGLNIRLKNNSMNGNGNEYYPNMFGNNCTNMDTNTFFANYPTPLEQIYAPPYQDFQIAHHQLATDQELKILDGQLERERIEYIERCKTLKNQLQDLRKDFENLKVSDRECQLDKIHAETQNRGDNKYSTLKKVKIGTMKSRVAFFEEL